ncbi:MAG: acyltransferase [Anaerolineales bacterium]
MNARATWVDYGKGIGIALVVYAHLLSSAYHNGLAVPQRFFEVSDSAVYSFHMPLFFFLSGLFAKGSLNKRGARAYLADKAARIFYPYVIWSILQISAEALFAGQSQQGASFSTLLTIPFQGWGQFWFLYALFWMHVTYAACAAFGKYANVSFLLISVFLFTFSLPTGLFELGSFSFYVIYFSAGTALMPLFQKMEARNIPLWAAFLGAGAFLAAACALFIAALAPGRIQNFSQRYIALLFATFGILSFSALAQALAREKALPLLETLGKYSLQIYLVHMLAGVGMRVLLLQMGVENWLAHIFIGTVFALTAPIALQKISDRLHFPYLFEFPRLQRASTAQDG